MKSYILMLLLLTIAYGCREETSNQALYDEVMSIHDEVMPRMDDIYRIRTALREKLATDPDMSESERAETAAMIARLDSAGESMMVWMREFNPVADSVAGADSARAYLQSELVRVKQVRKNITEALTAAENK